MVLGKEDKNEYEDWFDNECKQVTKTKNIAYIRMQQRSHTRNSTEEYRVARREEKRVHKKKKKKFNKDKLLKLENLRESNDVRKFYEE